MLTSGTKDHNSLNSHSKSSENLTKTGIKTGTD